MSLRVHSLAGIGHASVRHGLDWRGAPRPLQFARDRVELYEHVLGSTFVVVAVSVRAVEHSSLLADRIDTVRAVANDDLDAVPNDALAVGVRPAIPLRNDLTCFPIVRLQREPEVGHGTHGSRVEIVSRCGGRALSGFVGLAVHGRAGGDGDDGNQHSHRVSFAPSSIDHNCTRVQCHGGV
jgi:hypothetical protein